MIGQFQQTVWKYYQAHGRHDLPWRQLESDGTLDGYKVLVSELMLQQTQVPRVIPKFEAFVRRFPTVQALAAAPLAGELSSRQLAAAIADERLAGVLDDLVREGLAQKTDNCYTLA